MVQKQEKLHHHHHHRKQNFCLPLNFRILFLVGVLCLVTTCAQADDYLKKAPSFLNICKLSDSHNGECFARAVENIFTNWKDGIPGLKSLGSIDPFHVKKVHFEHNNQNINIKLDAKDATVTGLSQTRVSKASISDGYNFKLLLKLPKMRAKGIYRLKGTILLLHLDGSGPLDSELADAEVVVSVKAQLIEAKNQKFFDITHVQSSIKKISNFHVQFDNLFNGNKELEDSANALFNDNWRELFEILRPALEETLDTFVRERFKAVFSFVPANYFFEDLP